jgi:hypothetical protein
MGGGFGGNGNVENNHDLLVPASARPSCKSIDTNVIREGEHPMTRQMGREYRAAGAVISTISGHRAVMVDGATGSSPHGDDAHRSWSDRTG